MFKPDLSGQVAVVTGGSGVLGRAMSQALAEAGSRVAVLGRSLESATRAVQEISKEGQELLPLACDVLDRSSLLHVRDQVRERFGQVDILVNAAGGNRPDASTSPERSFFDLEAEAVDQVIRLNFLGTVLACQVFAEGMVEQGAGSIVNIASVAAMRPLTRVAGYSAAKAAVVNFTQWLAVHLAKEHSPGIRVNAIAPGFFLAEQNRYLLVEPDGSPTPRAQAILAHTPMGRFGLTKDLISTLYWLVSPDSGFVSGVIVPVDGGFSAFSGV